MPTPYNYPGDNSLEIIFRLIKGKVDDVAGEIPTVDTAISDDSTNPVTSAAIYGFVTQAITEAISSIPQFSFVIVNNLIDLPQPGESNHIYLVPQVPAGPDGNKYDEWIWITDATASSGGRYELIGSTEVDLSGYVQKSQMHELTESEVTTIFNNSWK